MIQLKYFLSGLTFILFSSVYCQVYGSIDVEAFTNTTLNLDDNVEIDGVVVKIINERTGEDTTVTFAIGNNKRPYLKAGKYELVCSVNSEKNLVVKNVIVNGDTITFVKLLYEPKVELSYFERRKRKKQLFEYER